MRIIGTGGRGADPALRRSFPADQPAAVATAVVGGADVVVTLTDEHEDFDCHFGELHGERCPRPGMRVWERATGALLRRIPDVCDNGVGFPAVLVTAVAGGRPLAVVRDWARPPKVVDLETGRRVGALAGHEDAADVQDLAVAWLADGPAVVTAGWDGVLRVTVLPAGRTMAVDTGERLNAVAVLHLGGRPVAAVGPGPVTLWDLTDGTRVGLLEPDGERMPCAIVSWPDGAPQLAVLESDGGSVLWDARTGQRRRLGLHTGVEPWHLAAAVAADGRRLLVLADGDAVDVWDVDGDLPFGPPLVGPVRHACLLADGPGGLLIASPTDDAVSFWRLAGDRPDPRRVPDG